MRVTQYGPLMLMLILSGSCVGTEIGNPPTPTEETSQVDVDLIAVDHAPAAALPIALTVADGFEVDRAVLLVGDFRFRRAETCREAGADRTDGFVAELLDPTVEMKNIDLPVGSYCGVDIRPRRGGEDGFAPDYPEFDGLTAYAEGTFQGTPFVVRYESDDELEFQGAFDLPPGQQTLFVAVDIPVWFEGMDLTGADTDADGRIVIGQGGSYLERLKENFERSVSVALDANGDRMLTSEDANENEDVEESE